MSQDLVFHIQRFSIHDGPGIRTTVFLKGCSMDCFWCHNPEGRHPYRELQFFPAKCVLCGECVRVCPSHAHVITDGTHTFLRDLCTTNGACVEVCCSGALEMNGRVMSVDDVMEEVIQDVPFYTNSGGGVTLSGGEPGLNARFSREILARCKDAGIATAVETCGYCSREALSTLLPVTDLFMMDLKLATPELHKEATGNTNTRILENARMLAGTDTPIIFRTPIVPTVNDMADEFSGIVSLIRELMALRSVNGHTAPIAYELLAFHKLGSDKYTSLGMDYRASHLEPPSKEQMHTLLTIARDAGVDARIR